MLDEINYTLLSDGSSDKALMPIIEWTICQLRPALLVQGSHADLTRLKVPPKDLTQRVNKALEFYPCDLLFIHRDSEGQSYDTRIDEIKQAVLHSDIEPCTVGVIPVRMMEAWLLIDEQAIKTAAGNPNGRYKVDLPKIRSLENIHDPKAELQKHLKQASGLKGRQLDKFNVGRAVHLVAQNIRDFSPLKSLNAYQEFVNELTMRLSTLESN